MSRKEALHRARVSLASHSIPEASLEAELLLMAVLGLDRTQLYSQWEVALSMPEAQGYRALLERRLRREPTAYILAFKEFYGLEFQVDPRVFIPRPETELLVDEAMAFLARRFSSSLDKPLVADIGTGCGAIAVALAHYLPHIQVYATDISFVALEMASHNSARHGVADCVRFLHGDLLEPLPEPADLVVANLPYIRDGDFSSLASEVRDYEPRGALAGGPQGLDAIAALLAQAPEKLRPEGGLLVEIGQDQGPAVMALARLYFPKSEIKVLRDLGGWDRVMVVEN